MRKVFTWHNWAAWLLFQVIFALDNLACNLWIWRYGQAETIEEFYRNVQFLCLCLTLFAAVPYIMLMFRIAPKLHRWDRFIIACGLLSVAVQADDYITNYNIRPTWFDWWFFYGLIFIFTVLKTISHVKKDKNIL